MPRVLVKCPVDGKIVPTGHRMTASRLEASEGRFQFRCASCGAIHEWSRPDAWLEENVR